MIQENSQRSRGSAKIEIDGLCVSFGEKRVLDGFSLQLDHGERAILAGPSGCGKTSVLRCVLGFMRPCGGSIRIDGQQLWPQSVWQLRQRMAYVPQEPDLGEMTARQWIDEIFAFRANEDLRHNLANLDTLLEEVALTPTHLSQKGAELSGGEKQRIALVAAFLLGRDIILLDEPTSALDPDTGEKVYECLARRRSTMLIVSHDAEPHPGLDARVVRMKPINNAEKNNGSD